MGERNESFQDRPPNPSPQGRDEFSNDDDPVALPVRPTDEECTMAVFAHIGAFLTFFIVPLVLWQLQKDKSRFITAHAKEALNFQLALTIYYIVGCLILPIIVIYEIYYVVRACMAASRGQPYRIPLNIRFFK